MVTIRFTFCAEGWYGVLYIRFRSGEIPPALMYQGLARCSHVLLCVLLGRKARTLKGPTAQTRQGLRDNSRTRTHRPANTMTLNVTL